MTSCADDKNTDPVSNLNDGCCCTSGGQCSTDKGCDYGTWTCGGVVVKDEGTVASPSCRMTSCADDKNTDPVSNLNDGCCCTSGGQCSTDKGCDYGTWTCGGVVVKDEGTNDYTVGSGSGQKKAGGLSEGGNTTVLLEIFIPIVVILAVLLVGIVIYHVITVKKLKEGAALKSVHVDVATAASVAST